MKNISIFKDNVKRKQYPSLDSNKKVDVLIIGGGITGVSTLYNLKDSDLDVILVEQNKIAFSTTGNSTGKLSYLQNDLLDKIRSSFSDKVCLTYIKSQMEAIATVKNIINKNGITCDLKKVYSYIYTNKDYEVEKLKNLEHFLKSNGIKTLDADNSLVKSKYMFKVSDTYIFNPVKYVYGLLDNIDNLVYENTSIKRIERNGDIYICKTDKYSIEAKYVVIASHYPYFNLPFFFPFKASLEKSYLSASKYKTKDLSLISYSNPFVSFRTYKDYLIYLSNSHDVNNNLNDFYNYEELLKKLNDLNLKPDYLWSNIDVMSSDGLPYIGRLKDNIFMATGYNTWGLTNGSLASLIISDIILGKKNKYIDLFDPKRLNLAKFTGGISNACKSLFGIVNGLFYKNDKIKYVKINGKRVMIFEDDNKKYIVSRTCPHMGCHLTFNEIEKTWDCPCHGSRFNIDGKVISAPSNYDIAFKE